MYLSVVSRSSLLFLRSKISNFFQKRPLFTSKNFLNNYVLLLPRIFNEFHGTRLGLLGYDNVYRIRIGNLRAFFIFHIQVIDDCVFFKYLVLTGEAYDKKYKEKLVVY